MFDVTALGELLIDFSATATDALGYPTMKANPGGAPSNFLSALSAYGAKTAFIGKVGCDSFGRLLLSTLSERGINTEGVILDPSVFTTLAFVTLSQSGDRSFSFARKPGADTKLEFAEIDLSIIEKSKIFHFGSLSLTDEPSKTAVKKTVEYAKKLGKFISFDPNLRKPLWGDLESAKREMLWSIEQADFVKISEEEIDFLWQCDIKTAAYKMLYDFNVTLVLITMGAGGAYIANIRNGVFSPCPEVTAIDTTGAGDICAGAALSRILKSESAPDKLTESELLSIIRFSVVAASLSTQKSGGIPSIPTETAVMELLCKML